MLYEVITTRFVKMPAWGQGLIGVAVAGILALIATSGASPSFFVAAETCRVADAVWEFSPNEMFKFLTTSYNFV